MTGFESEGRIDVTGCEDEGCAEGAPANAAPALQGAGTECRCLACVDAELVKVIEAWPRLPEPARVTILALAARQLAERSD